MKIVNMLFYGTIFWLAFTFLFYGGLYVNYIQHYGVSIFFNRFFMTAQIWWLWPVGILVCGYLFVAEIGKTIKLLLFMIFVAAMAVTWVPAFGKEAGERLFMKRNLSYRIAGKEIQGATLLYHTKACDFVMLPNAKVTPCLPPSKRAVKE